MNHIKNFLDENNPEIQYDVKKQQIDVVYLHNMKKKVEMLLEKIIEKFDLFQYMSEKKRFRLDYIKINNSKYREFYEKKKDINGNNLRYGYDYIPTDFEDWLKTYIPDYVITENIYTYMCEARRIQKDDLKQLNKIAKKYFKE